MNSESIYHKVEQGTEEWFNLRLGRFTASTIKNLLMAPTTKGYQDEIKRIAFEIVTGTKAEDYQNEWMRRGSEMEAEARMHYEATTFNPVSDGGFFTYGDYMGASPDGLIGDDGLLEIKCPKYNTIIDYLIDGKLPKQYEAQVQAQLLCAGRDWCDFVAYHPGIKMLILRVEADMTIQENIIIAVENAVEKVNEIIKKIS